MTRQHAHQPHDRIQAPEDRHGHEHGHGLDQGVGHQHAPSRFGLAFAVGIGLNTAFVVVEAVFGLIGNSISLLADAGHNLSDVLGLVVAYVASRLVARRATLRMTYGLKGSSILAALFNAVFLLVVVGGLVWEAILRLAAPRPVAGVMVMIVAGVGILVNGITAWLFASGAKSDINLRGAFMHMASDALVSAGVVLAGLLTLLTGWLWLDPVTSLLVNAVIVIGTWQLLRDSVLLALQAVPPGIDPVAVRGFLAAQPGVATLHDFHIWPMSTTETALSAHLEMPDGHPGDLFLRTLSDGLRSRFGIIHVTVQIEIGTAGLCPMVQSGLVCTSDVAHA